MKIYPINQSPVMFRGTNKNTQHSTMKRYCEPRTGVYYYYDSVQFQNKKKQNGFSNIIKNVSNKLNNMSKEVSNIFTLNNSNPDDINWL